MKTLVMISGYFFELVHKYLQFTIVFKLNQTKKNIKMLINKSIFTFIQNFQNFCYSILATLTYFCYLMAL